MAAKSFVLCDVNKFEKEDFQFDYQSEFFEDDENFMGEGTPKVSLSSDKNKFNHMCYRKILGSYDYIHQKKGKVFNKYFSRYFEEFKFPIYYNENESFLMIQIKTDVGLEFIESINSNENFNVKVINIDFEKIVQNVPEISGAWIAELKSKHLKSTGLFGPKVNLSEEYKEAINEGEISSMIITFIYDSCEFKVNISRKGSVTLLNKIASPEQEIEILNEIYTQLLKK